MVFVLGVRGSGTVQSVCAPGHQRGEVRRPPHRRESLEERAGSGATDREEEGRPG